MNPLAPASKKSNRPPVLLWLVVLALAVYLSGCCGSCCRAMLGSPGGSSNSDSGGLSSAPNSGSVSSLIAQQVGPFRLLGTAPVTRLGSSLSPGVVDSIGAVYSNASGEQLNQIVLAYPSESVASMRMDAVFRTIAQECPGKRLMRGDITNRSGAVIGKKVVCDSSPQHVYWNNGRILTFVTAPHPGALLFHNASAH